MRMILMLNRTGRLLLLMVGTSVALAGCSGATGTQGDGRMTVVASIYPLQYVVEQVGGDLVAVSTVTPAGADPHAVELSPRQLRRFGEADAARAPEQVLDVAAAAELRPLPAGAATSSTCSGARSAIASSTAGWNPDRYTTASASPNLRSWRGESSTACGSAPAGVTVDTATKSPPTCSTTYCSG